MADAALFIGWGSVVRGREERALEVFNESLTYYSELQSQHVIDSFEVAILEPHGGDLDGFIFLRGEPSKLEKLRRDDEFQRRTARAQLIVDKVGVVGATIGAGLTSLMSMYRKEVESLRGAVTV